MLVKSAQNRSTPSKFAQKIPMKWPVFYGFSVKVSPAVSLSFREIGQFFRESVSENPVKIDLSSFCNLYQMPWLMHCHKLITDRHTGHCEDSLCQWTMHFGKFEWGYVYMVEWKMSFPPERKEEGSKWWWKQNIDLATWNVNISNIFKILSLANNGALVLVVWVRYSELDKEQISTLIVREKFCSCGYCTWMTSQYYNSLGKDI